MVNISLRVLSRPDSAQLPTIYRQLGVDYDERVLPSICNEANIRFFIFSKDRHVFILSYVQNLRISLKFFQQYESQYMIFIS